MQRPMFSEKSRAREIWQKEEKYTRRKKYSARSENDTDGKIRKLAQALGQWKESKKAKTHLAFAEIQYQWEKIIGKGSAAHAEPVELQYGTLILKVSEDIWRFQLRMMKGEIIAKINRTLGRKAVKDIRFTI